MGVWPKSWKMRIAVVLGAVVALLAVGVWLLLAQPWAGDVRVTTNYLERINEPIREIPEDERAWPLYLKAIERGEPLPGVIKSKGWPQTPSAEHWDEAAAYLKRNKEVIELIREAAAREHLGYIYKPNMDWAYQRALAERRGTAVPPEPTRVPENPPVVTAVRPFATESNLFFRMMRTDLLDAVEAEDGQRAAADLRTLFGLVRHTKQVKFFSVLRGLARLRLTVADTGEILAEQASLFSSEQWRAIGDQLATVSPRDWFLDGREFDRRMFMDVVQRIYTDNGSGSGQMSAAAKADLEWDIRARGLPTSHIRNKRSPPRGSNPGASAGTDRRGGHAANAQLAAPRDETVELYQDCMSDTESFFTGKPWNAETWDAPSVDRVHQSGNSGPFFLIDHFWSNQYQTATLAIASKTRISGLRLAIHAELQRRATGSHPAAREDFPAAVQDSWPRDPFDGQPLRYRLKDGAPLIYSVGPDRDDDGGTPTDRNPAVGLDYLDPDRWQRELEKNPDAKRHRDGDWVVFPPLEDE